jgi:hypothetical protein
MNNDAGALRSLRSSPANRWLAAHPARSAIGAVLLVGLIFFLPNPNAGYWFIRENPGVGSWILGLLALVVIISAAAARDQVRRIDSENNRD